MLAKIGGFIFSALILFSIACESIAQGRLAPNANQRRARSGWGKEPDFTPRGWIWHKRALFWGACGAVFFVIGIGVLISTGDL